MDNQLKGQILNNYLTHQMMATTDVTKQVQSIDFPDTHNLDEFKNQVKMWIELDNQVKKLQALVKERNKAKSMLTMKILDFMSKYNIEDLNTKEGKLRFKSSTKNKNASLKEIKQRLQLHYPHVSTIDELTSKVFEPIVVEHQTLRRLKPSSKN